MWWDINRVNYETQELAVPNTKTANNGLPENEKINQVDKQVKKVKNDIQISTRDYLKQQAEWLKSNPVIWEIRKELSLYSWQTLDKNATSTKEEITHIFKKFGIKVNLDSKYGASLIFNQAMPVGNGEVMKDLIKEFSHELWLTELWDMNLDDILKDLPQNTNKIMYLKIIKWDNLEVGSILKKDKTNGKISLSMRYYMEDKDSWQIYYLTDWEWKYSDWPEKIDTVKGAYWVQYNTTTNRRKDIQRHFDYVNIKDQFPQLTDKLGIMTQMLRRELYKK
jgi:hypothetical protein